MNSDVLQTISVLDGWLGYPKALAIMSLICFAAMGFDKRLAKKKSCWRVPEKTLFAFAALGGALGGIIGMHTFRHKTKHTSFKIGMPLLLVFNIAVCVFLMTKA